MRVPLAWLRDYVDLPADPKQVAQMLAQIGFPIAAIVERPVLTGVLAGRIEQLEKHPNADRLLIGRINVGDGTPLTIATAATNVAHGQTIPVATIGARLSQITIERRTMRGIESQGMMVSAGELALPPEWFEDGIMQLEADLPLGTDLVEHLRLSEPVLDVEVTSNRADALSMIGLARELAAYQGTALRLPSFEFQTDERDDNLRITIESPDCRRFVAQRFTGVRVGAAPAWLRIRLALAGQRPINNVVDVSNYVMLETGQPLHFYDNAKVRGDHLIVRDARPGERFITLDGVERELDARALVIASEDAAQALAGLKGGATAEVSERTSAIILESANFVGARIRRTSAQFGLRTDAGTRHEKALPLCLTDMGAARAAHLLTAQGASAHEALAMGAPVERAAAIAFDPRDVRRLLGFDLNVQEVREYLDRLGFEVEVAQERLSVTPPLWRPDVTLDADLIEEIARMAGYDRVESVLPAVAQHEIPSNDYELESRIAQTLCALGYHEVLTYSLHGAQVFEKMRRAGIEPSSMPIEVLNPLSEDQRFLRYALGPAMLEYCARIDSPARIFEIGHVFSDADGRPEESLTLAFAMAAEAVDEPPWRDSNFLRIKSDCEAFITRVTGRQDYEVVADARNGLHPGKTAVVLIDGKEIANVGRTDPRIDRAFGIRLPMYFVSVYLDNIPEYRIARYVAPSKYPSTYRDLALLCDLDLPAARLERAIRRAIGTLCISVRAFDEYRGAQVAADKKSLALRVTIARSDATITDAQADAAIDRALQAVNAELGVTLRA